MVQVEALAFEQAVLEPSERGQPGQRRVRNQEQLARAGLGQARHALAQLGLGQAPPRAVPDHEGAGLSAIRVIKWRAQVTRHRRGGRIMAAHKQHPIPEALALDVGGGRPPR